MSPGGPEHPGRPERPTGPEPVALPYLGRRALRFWRSAGVAFAVMAGAAVLLGYHAWQPYRSQAVLMFDQAQSAHEGAFDLTAAGARLKELFLAGDRLGPLVARHGLFPELSPAAAIEETKKRLGFEVRPGGTFVLSFVGTSPAGAQVFLRELTTGLVDAHHDERKRTATASRELVTEERVALEKVVAERELELARFFARHPDAGVTAPAASSEPEILLLEQQLLRLRGGVATRGATGERNRMRAELTERLRTLEAAAVKARQELDDKLGALTEAHPDVILARRRLVTAEAEVGPARAALLQLGPAPATAEEGSPEAAIAQMEAQISGLRAAERAQRIQDPRKRQLALQLDGLRESLAETRNRLSKIRNDELRAEMFERMEKSESLPRLTALDPGSLPGSPLTSRRRRIALGGSLLAAALAAGLALGRAMVSDRLFDPTDIAHLAGAGVLAVVPPVPSRQR